MPSKRARLDRFISQTTGISLRDIKPLLAQGRVEVDGHPASHAHQVINEFSYIALDDKVLQKKTPLYIMLNKPEGVVSATKDSKHSTVVDLLRKHPHLVQENDLLDLHIAGRLDFNSTGLILLTNHGRWSRRLSEPENSVVKTYHVTLEKPLSDDYVRAFAEGMYFPYEDITTRPAQLNIISEHVASVSLVEGRYHQIKRMFGRFQNRVIALERVAISDVVLDADLARGDARHLTTNEVESLAVTE